MSITANLGYPRIGKHRELKFALENYWSGKWNANALLAAGRELRLENWQLQKDAGIQSIPGNDFSFYDQVLDTLWMAGAIPQRFSALRSRLTDLDLYFAMARGWQDGDSQVAAMEMTKWFDTNYHYIVPEISSRQEFTLNSRKVINEFLEARQQGIQTRPVLLGPVSFLLLSKPVEEEYPPLLALEKLLPVYRQLLAQLAEAGAQWVQLDEPCLLQDIDDTVPAAYRAAYSFLGQGRKIKILLTTCFGSIADSLPLLASLPVDGLHVDLVRSPEQLGAVLTAIPVEWELSLGLVDGRNVWKTDLTAAAELVHTAISARGAARLQIAPSCSLQFCPQDLELETEMDAEVRDWLAFARQKLDELVILSEVANGHTQQVSVALAANRKSVEDRKKSAQVTNQEVQKRLQHVRPSDHQRCSPYSKRIVAQCQRFHQPVLPTTTIGSFPQTAEVRRQRSLFKQGKIDRSTYENFIKEQILDVIRLQEELGLDVLVHGEFERTDMVEYFAEQMNGFLFTRQGWVQSYGSRAVRPPVLFGDVSRPRPMTVSWSTYAQSLTQKPMKGMLTGPVTLLQWSFVRDDQPRKVTCQQIALALRDEVHDLEAAGIGIIQVDEPALREGLPLRKADRSDYLDWAVDCFRLATAGVEDGTQIHTHMCYSEFNEILPAIVRMDADVISIEASRSKMELLDGFEKTGYPNEIGPGIYDIHSPRIPEKEEMLDLIEKALEVIPAERLWINPDCGLKTRGWEEAITALRNMIAAAQAERIELGREG